MTPGSIFFHKDFAFHDGKTGDKLFIILGTKSGISLVAKTTSKSYGKNLNFGCQPNDRFHNFYLPQNSCYLKGHTWICLNEFYEFKDGELLQKRFSGVVNHICDIDPGLSRDIQHCALLSDDLSGIQSKIVSSSLITVAK